MADAEATVTNETALADRDLAEDEQPRADVSESVLPDAEDPMAHAPITVRRGDPSDPTRRMSPPRRQVTCRRQLKGVVKGPLQRTGVHMAVGRFVDITDLAINPRWMPGSYSGWPGPGSSVSSASASSRVRRDELPGRVVSGQAAFDLI